MPESALDRTAQFIGEEGIAKLRSLRVAVVGVGGLGTQVVQQLALLRVGHLCLIDPGKLKVSNRNRYIGILPTDQAGVDKTEIGARLSQSIAPETRVTPLPISFVTEDGFSELRAADYVFGCLDHDGARYVLNECCSAFQRPYIDIASEITPLPDRSFGGRVCISHSGQGCLNCREDLDQDEIKAFGFRLAGESSSHPGCDLIGITLPGGGPAVVNLNGLLASIAVTEFLVWVAGIRKPVDQLHYHGMMGYLSRPAPRLQPKDCHICAGVYGKGELAGLSRYLARQA